MPKTATEIVTLHTQRRNDRGAVLARMEMIKVAYNGDLVLPLPELDANERNMVANLVQGGIDQLSMRIASVMPTVWFPPKRAGKAEANRARTKRDVIAGWWDHPGNRVPIKLRRQARHFVGYGMAAATVRPGGDRQPQWRLVDPLSCFPAPGLDPDEIVPPDCLNTYVRSGTWLEKRYPEQMKALRKGTQMMFEVIEYVDATEIVMVVKGAPGEPNDRAAALASSRSGDGGADALVLARVPNRADRPLVFTAGRVTLDRNLGQFDGAIGMMHAKSMFMALGVIAQKRAIFPEMWLVSGGGGQAEVVQDAEPMAGQVGIVTGASDFKQVRMETSVFTQNYLDRLEYEARQDSDTPAEWGGSGSQNIRTGRRGAQVLAAATDYPIQEAQCLLEAFLEEQNKAAIAIAKKYQDRPTSMYVKGRGEITFTPTDTFDDDVHEVRYAYPGADANNLNIQVGQKVGIGTLSKRSGMEMDPMVRDVESELDRIRVEKVEDAFLASLQTLASTPDGPWQPEDWARWAALVASDRSEPWDAAAKVNEERKAAQLAQAQQTAPPEQMMPGLAQPGQPGAPMPAIGPAEPSLANLRATLANLRLGQMQGPAEQIPQPAGVPA